MSVAVGDARGCEAATPARIRGTVEAFDGHVLTVNNRNGARVRVKMAENFTVGGLVRASLADATVGSFVGAAALPQPDGTLRAIEVLIFPESARGTGEGHGPFTASRVTVGLFGLVPPM